MALIEQDRSTSSWEPDSTDSASLSDSLHLHPQPPEGIFKFEPLPMFDTVVDPEYVVSKDYNRIDGVGKTWLERWRMSDGTYYDVLIGEPESPRINISVFSSPPWGARIQGLTENIAHLVMQSGFPTVFVSTEIGKPQTQYQIAHNMHQIMNRADQRGIQQPKKAVWVGISRAAMMSFGVVDYAEANDREVIYSDIIDACLPHKIDFTDPFEAIENIQYLSREIRGLLHHLIRVSRDDIVKIYLPTVGCSWEYLGQVVKGGVPLFSGDAGKLAARLPQGTNMHVTFYRGCAPNKHEIYLQMLSKHPGVVSEIDDGIHTKFLNPSELGKITCRLASLGNQLADGAKTDEIDFDRVHWPSLQSI